MSTQTDDFTDPESFDDFPAPAPGVSPRGLPASSELRTMSPADILAALGPVGDAADVLESDQFGPILDNKDRLIGVPIYVIGWEFHDGDFGRFVTMMVMTKAGDKFLVNDGSTGIAAQLQETEEAKGVVPFLARNGLRRSDYEKEIDGKASQATTYYIDTSL